MNNINENKNTENKIVEFNANINFSANGFVLSPNNMDAEDEFYEKVIRPAEKRLLRSIKSEVKDE